MQKTVFIKASLFHSWLTCQYSTTIHTNHKTHLTRVLFVSQGPVHVKYILYLVDDNVFELIAKAN